MEIVWIDMLSGMCHNSSPANRGMWGVLWRLRVPLLGSGFKGSQRETNFRGAPILTHVPQARRFVPLGAKKGVPFGHSTN